MIFHPSLFSVTHMYIRGIGGIDKSHLKDNLKRKHPLKTWLKDIIKITVMCSII